MPSSASLFRIQFLLQSIAIITQKLRSLKGQCSKIGGYYLAIGLEEEIS